MRRRIGVFAALVSFSFVTWFGTRTVVSQDAATDYAKEWQRLATPSAGHKKLDALVGTWLVSTPTIPQAGTLTAKSILGGRFVELDSDAGEYHGLGLIGYDNSAAHYVLVSVDTNQTHMPLSTGSYDEGAKAFLFTCEMNDPVLKVKCKVRSTITLTSADQFHWESWVDYLNGKPEIKTVDSTYKRKG
jgi:hypothetical protein